MLILMGVGSTASLGPGPPSFHAINSCLTFDPQKRVDEVLLEVKGQAEFLRVDGGLPLGVKGQAWFFYAGGRPEMRLVVTYTGKAMVMQNGANLKTKDQLRVVYHMCVIRYLTEPRCSCSLES